MKKLLFSNEIDRLRYGDYRKTWLSTVRQFGSKKCKIQPNKDEILKFRDLDYYHTDVTRMDNPSLVIDRYCLNMPN